MRTKKLECVNTAVQALASAIDELEDLRAYLNKAQDEVIDRALEPLWEIRGMLEEYEKKERENR